MLIFAILGLLTLALIAVIVMAACVFTALRRVARP
jgi:hypothetical protein